MGSPALGHDSEAISESAQADDARLVAAAQAERQAFATLYERYVTPVYRYCYHRLGNREAAEDATSQVFTKALGALPRYRPEGGSFRSWLFVIAHNTVLDHIRLAHPIDSLDGVAVAERLAGPEELAIAEQELGELRRLLMTLPEDQRRVMELRLSGLSSPEVAAILGRSPTAIRSLQFRAVERLRLRLANDVLTKEQTHAGR